jgi:hypothetical protein
MGKLWLNRWLKARRAEHRFTSREETTLGKPKDLIIAVGDGEQ